MTRPADTVVRDAVHDLAGEARMPTDLAAVAAVAVVKGRRMRRRRRASVAAAAVAAVALTATPYAVLRSERATPQAGWQAPTATPSPEASSPTSWLERPFTLPGGWVITGATAKGTTALESLVLDRERGKYIAVSGYEETWAAPRGRIAAVVDYDRPSSLGLLDVGTQKVRWVKTGAGSLDPVWSPDGRRLVLTGLDKETGAWSFEIVDAQTGKVARHPYDWVRYECTDVCQFTWSPDGKEVALPQSDPKAPRSEAVPHLRRGIQFFSATDGRPTRLVPVHGNVAGAAAWSPDGGSVVVQGQKGPELAEVANGKVVRSYPTDAVHWIDDHRLLHVGDGEAVLLDVSGKELERAPLPDELTEYQYISVAPA
jgi:hypothetical protein